MDLIVENIGKRGVGEPIVKFFGPRNFLSSVSLGDETRFESEGGVRARFLSDSLVASAWTCSRRNKTCPSTTWSPSLTRISRTIPPSKCCTVLRFVSVSTNPLAMTALSSLATAAHTPATPKVIAISVYPANASGRHSEGDRLDCFFFMVVSRVA